MAMVGVRVQSEDVILKVISSEIRGVAGKVKVILDSILAII
jgi:hypothetical protein